MHFSFLALLLMSLNFTHAIPLQTDDEPAADILSSFENLNLFDATESLEPDPQDDSLLSPAEDLVNYFAPTSFIADDNGNNINDDMQLLSSESDTSCPVEKRKRNTGVCSPSAAPPNLAAPNILDSPGWEEGSPTKVDPFEGLGDDPCILRVGYPIHVCCRGPWGQYLGGEYLTIENCYLGQFFSLHLPPGEYEEKSQINSIKVPFFFLSSVTLPCIPRPFSSLESKIRNN